MADVRENDVKTVDEKMRAELDKALSEPPRMDFLAFLLPVLTAAGLMGATALFVKYVL